MSDEKNSPAWRRRRDGYATQGDGDARTTRVALPWADLSMPIQGKGDANENNPRPSRKTES